MSTSTCVHLADDPPFACDCERNQAVLPGRLVLHCSLQCQVAPHPYPCTAGVVSALKAVPSHRVTGHRTCW